MEELMTVREAADMLKVSEATIRRWIEAGKLTELRHPDGAGSIRIRANEVRNFFRPKPGC